MTRRTRSADRRPPQGARSAVPLLTGPSPVRSAPVPGGPQSGLAALLDMQTLILRDMAAGQPADALAERLCRLAEQHAPGRIATLMRLRPDGRLGMLAAPGAAEPLRSALDGVQPGPGAGSCGAAIHHRGPVYAGDASTDPSWSEQRDLAAAHQIRSCWSYPISQGERLLGTFALTGSGEGLPDAAERELLEHCAAISGSILLLAELQEERERQDQRLRRLTRFNAMLAQVNQLAAGRPDHTALYQGICRIAVQQAGLRLAWVGAPDRTEVFQVFAAAGAIGFLDEIFVTADPALPEGHGLSGTAWREARTVVRQRFYPDRTLGSWLAAARRFGLGAGAAMPLLLHGRPHAVLHVYVEEEGVLDGELVALLEELATDVGRALDALDQQRSYDRLAALHAALLAEGAVLLEAQSDAEMLLKTCERLVEGSLFHLAWVARPDENGVLQALAGAGPGMAELRRMRLALDDDPPAVAARAWLTGQTVVHNDLRSDAELARFFEMFRVTGWQSVIAVPIHRSQALFAVLMLGAPETGLFDADLTALCERIAQLLGRGLDSFDLKAMLERERGRQFHLARHDALTGLPNRRQFEEHLALALARSRRQGRPLAVCLLDIDDFKPVNDSWGHAAGDEVLRQVAARLRDSLRRSDLLARLGGDEFVLAIEDFGTVVALPALLDRVNQAFTVPFDLGEGRSARIGLSMGVAIAPEDGEEADLLMRRADIALYAAKARKAARVENWRRWTAELAQPEPPALGLTDAYGPAAAQLLAGTAALWPVVIDAFTTEFSRRLGEQPAAARILRSLSDAEMDRLRAAQAEHLIRLLSPELSRETLERTAARIGRTHALVGVDSALLVHAAGLLQTSLGEHLAARPLRPSERQNLMSVITLRLHDDGAAQMQAHAETLTAFFDHLLRRLPPPGSPWADAAQAELDALAGLPGIRGCGVLQPDGEGRFQVLASSSGVGLSFERFRAASGTVPAIDSGRAEGRGLMETAWHTGEVETAENFLQDLRTAPWHVAGRQLGVRSAAALPVKDAEDRPVAMLILLGAYPGQFGSQAMHYFCHGLAQRLWRLWRQRRTAASAVVPEATAQTWRRRLFSGGLVMQYQPLVDLHTGRVVKAEALARLVLEDGRTIEPGTFLPVLGARDMDELFRRSFAEALTQLAAWDTQGLSLGMAVNLAPSTLAQPDCAFWVGDALRRAAVAPERIDLEITEEQPFGDAEAAISTGSAVAALARLGVNIVMDDLGAGHSSLRRLRSLPFRAIKLDQGLVAGMRRTPLKTVGFIGALVQLGHDLDADVVVEGLENVEMLEMATFLGASVGQGHALARPMLGADLPAWLRDFRWPVEWEAPRTPLGALALLWRSSQRDGAAHGPAEACPLARFIAGRGLVGGAVDAAHHALHAAGATEGRRSPAYRAALQRMERELATLVLDTVGTTEADEREATTLLCETRPAADAFAAG